MECWHCFSCLPFGHEKVDERPAKQAYVSTEVLDRHGTKSDRSQTYPPNEATGSPMAPTSNRFMIVLLLLSGTISMSATEALTTWEDLATRGADRACGRKALVLQPATACAQGRVEVMAKDMIA